jgi:hypothetical protein
MREHELGNHNAYGFMHDLLGSFGQRDQPFGMGRSGGHLGRERIVQGSGSQTVYCGHYGCITDCTLSNYARVLDENRWQ